MSNLFLRKMESGNRLIRNYFFKTLNKDNNLVVNSPVDMLQPISFSVGLVDIVVDKKVPLFDLKNILALIGIDFNYLSLNANDDCYINDYTFNNVFRDRFFIYIYKYDKCILKNAINIVFDDNIIESIKFILNSIDGLKLFSNFNQNNIISVKTSTFFDYYGTNYYSGGAERYLLDLYDVCRNLGKNMVVYQHAKKSFIRKYKDLIVVGLSSFDNQVSYDYTFIDYQTKNYIYHTYNLSNLHIYSAFQECFPNHIGPSIGISHGISWDNPSNRYSNGRDYFWESKKLYFDSAYYCNSLISVDTNTANWFQTIDYEIGNKKFKVIPNYVDNNEFSPRKDFLSIKNNKIVITYPRRLYSPRGLYVVLDIVDDILKKYDNVEFHFVGKGFDEDLKNIEESISKWPGRIKCYSKDPRDMKDVYKYTDISLIPTLFSEGTSLSCLEALSSGNLVISTRIGGLTDLVINGFNGYLIEPNSDALKECLINVLNDFSKQSFIRQNAIVSAKSFSKELWKERWIKELNKFDLGDKSINNELVEFYLNSVKSINSKVVKLIKKELIKGNLVYLRIKNKPVVDNITNGLLQLVDFDEEVVSDASRIYIEKNIVVDRSCKEKINL